MIHTRVFGFERPLTVVPVLGHPDVVVIRDRDELSIHVTAADIDRLTCALTQAREVLSHARAESKEQ